MREYAHETLVGKLALRMDRADGAKVHGRVPLDSISVAAHVNMRAVESFAHQVFPWMMLIIHVLTSETMDSSLGMPVGIQIADTGRYAVRDAELQPERTTTREYSTHIRELTSWMVLERKAGFLSAVYFAVKKGARFARAIFDCWQANEVGEEPPAFKLPTLAMMKDDLREFDGSQEMRFVTGDFRHWYYQIPLGEGARKLFGIKMGDERFRLRVLPMGWRWSPIIGQSIAWACILMDAPENLGVRLKDLNCAQGPPPKMYLYDGSRKVGIVYVYYDGVMVFAEEAYAKRWHEHLQGVESRSGAVWKELSEVARTCQFLGIDWTWNGRYVSLFITPARMQKWRESGEISTERCSIDGPRTGDGSIKSSRQRLLPTMASFRFVTNSRSGMTD